MNKKILTALAVILFSASLAAAQDNYVEEDARVLPGLTGRWQVADARNSVKQLFDFTLYDEYKDSGFLFFKTAKSFAKQLSGKNVFQGYSQIELNADGTFSAVDAVFDMTSGKKALSNSKTYSGSWKAGENVVYFSYVDKPSEEIISGDNADAVSVTAEFTYRIEASKLILFPKFNKKSSYAIFENYLKNPSRLYAARGIFYGILSNSQSSLGAYSVRRLLEAIDGITENPSTITRNLRFIKSVIDQWRAGKSGLAAEKVPKGALSKKMLFGKWYYEGAQPEDFMNMITPVMPCALTEIVLFRKRGDKKEDYFELDLKPDGSAFMRSFFTNVNKEEETYAVDMEGVWELEGNAVSMRFNRLLHDDSGKMTKQDSNLLYSFRASFTADRRFVISKNMPSAVGYVSVKEYIKNARTAQQHYPFEAIPDILNDKYSSLSAYDILRMKQLISIINESMPEKKMEAVNKACDEMDLIVGRWYDEYVRYNKEK